MYEGEGNNTIDLLYEDKTSECNGVKVIIPVKYEDNWNFYNKIKEQLAYFQNVYFNVNVNGETINNEFKIYRSEHYQLSELNEDSFLHICLDDVYYPIDFNKLGISSIREPIGLRFNLTDGIVPVPSRESILYTKTTKDLILNKIKLVANDIVSKHNETIKEVENIYDIFKYYSDSWKYIKIGHEEICVNYLEKFADVKSISPKLKGVELLDLKKIYFNRGYLVSNYKCNYTFNGTSFRENKSGSSKNIELGFVEEKKCYLYEDTIPFQLKSYIRENEYSSKYFIKKRYDRKLFPLTPNSGTDTNYFQLLELNLYPKEQWRQRIKEYQYIQELIFKDVTYINDIVIPQHWIDAKKKKKISIANGGQKKVKLEGEITCKEAINLLRCNNGNNCKFVSSTYKLDELSKIPYLMVYTTHDNKMNLDSLYRMSGNQRIKFLTFSDREIKIINKLNIHNLMSYEKFMEGKNMPFKRIVTAKLIADLVYKNRSVFDNIGTIKSISSSLGEKLNSLNEYKREHYYSASDKIYEAMVELAQEQNLFDENIYSDYINIKNILDKMPFINVLCSKIRAYNFEEDDMYSILIDMLKYHKQKIDYKHYNIKLNEKTLTKELIEEIS